MKNKVTALAIVACVAIALAAPSLSPAGPTKKSGQKGQTSAPKKGKKAPTPPPAKRSPAPPSAPAPAPPPATSVPSTNAKMHAPSLMAPQRFQAARLLPLTPATADQEVCLFQNANFGGWKFCTNLTGFQALPTRYVGQATSMTVPDGYRLRLFQREDRTGKQCVFYGQVGQVSPDCDNITTAISLATDPQWPAKQAAAQGQRLVENREMRETRARQARRDREAFIRSLTPNPRNSYTPDDIKIYMEEYPKTNVHAIVLSSSNLGEVEELFLPSGQRNLNNLREGFASNITLTKSWDDQINVATIAFPEIQVFAYEDENFRGRRIELTCGQWELQGDLKNKISSIEIKYNADFQNNRCPPGVREINEWSD
jgi:hypothetical protein